MYADRSRQEIFARHEQALGGEDLNGVVAAVNDDAVIITPARVLGGKDGVHENFLQLLGDGLQATWNIKNTAHESDAMLLEWGDDGGGNRADDGIDMSIFCYGMIHMDVIRYVLQHAG